MKLEELIKNLKEKNRELLKGILSSTKEHPITYLNEFKDSSEYIILNTLSKNKVLEKEQNGNITYFILTKKGEDYLKKIN